MQLKYKVIICDTAVSDIDNKEIDTDSVEHMVSFLVSDGCRSIGDRQKCLHPPKKIWDLRVPIQGRGSRGGGRVLYFMKEEKDEAEPSIAGSIYIHRIFQKKEVDDGKQKRKNVFNQALEELKNNL